MDKFIKSKESFVTRKELNDYYRQLSDKIKKKFNEMKGSSYPDIVEQLNQLLDTHFEDNFESYSAQNESNRHLYMLNVVKECAHFFENNLLRDYFAGNQFLRDDNLEQVFEIHRNRAINGFKSKITGEEESLFDEELREVNILFKNINNY